MTLERADQPMPPALLWEEFRAQAVARAGMHALSGESKHRLAYLALGLCGEAGEADDAHEEWERSVPGSAAALRNELGDVAWYAAMVEHETGLRAVWPLPTSHPRTRRTAYAIRALVRAACGVAECAKRPVQGRDLPRERLQRALDAVAAELHYLADVVGGMHTVTAANVAKNVARYGDGFTADKARALDGMAPK